MTAVLGGTSTFFTSAIKGTGVRGIQLDRAYEGDVLNGKRHGHGIYTYANGFFIYEGAWSQGRKHGVGRLSMKDGAFYEGQFQDDEMSGHGLRRFTNGNVYEGTFELGEMHGQGIMRMRNGDVYEGPMAHNGFEGEGIYRFVNGDVYEGSFAANLISGHGVMRYADGGRYVGEWVGGNRGGEGMCSYANGDTYQGAWADDVYNGHGSLHLARTGISYVGLFLNGAATTLPNSINVFYSIEEDPKAKLKKAAAAGKGAAPEPVLPNTLGTPLATALTVAVQFQAPAVMAQSVPVTPEAAAFKPTAAPAKGKAPPVPMETVIVMTQPAAEGKAWTTASMENGRRAVLTLHASAPTPLPAGQQLRVLLVAALDADGVAGCRLVLLQVHVEPALPLARQDNEVLYGIQLYLEAGQSAQPGLSLGCPEDFDRLQNANGWGALLASSYPLQPGFLRLGLPDLKAKNPSGTPRK